MQTLSRRITGRIFGSQAKYEAIQQRWSQIMNNPELAEVRDQMSPAVHLLYSALLGRDWRKGFTPPSTHLDEGAFGGWYLWHALRTLRLCMSPAPGLDSNPQIQAFHQQNRDQFLAAVIAPFAGTVTPEMARAVLAYLPLALRKDDIDPFTRDAWPFEAYWVVQVALQQPSEQTLAAA